MVTIILEVRECDTCGHEAVALEGIGTECAKCETGVYAACSGFKDIQTDAETAKQMEDDYPDTVMYVQGN